jgi:phosphopantothenate synthetase
MLFYINLHFNNGKVEEGKNLVAVEKKAVSRQDTVEIDPNIVFQNLIRAEATLIKEKKKMEALKENLLSKLNKKIESKTSNIQNLRAEIKDLKFACDELSKSLQNVENSNSSIEAEPI